MNTLIYVASVVCGLLTLLFIVAGIISQRRGAAMGMRSLLAFTGVSVLTAAFTIWQLVNTIHSIRW